MANPPPHPSNPALEIPKAAPWPTHRATWCTGCDLNLQEDILHCIWFCPLSRQVWQWAQLILHVAASECAPSPTLQPEHIFVAHPLPLEFLIPDLLWSITRPSCGTSGNRAKLLVWFLLGMVPWAVVLSGMSASLPLGL